MRMYFVFFNPHRVKNICMLFFACLAKPYLFYTYSFDSFRLLKKWKTILEFRKSTMALSIQDEVYHKLVHSGNLVVPQNLRNSHIFVSL